METQSELTAYEKRMLEIAERQSDALELLKVLGIVVLALLAIGAVIGAIVALS